jgi:hypothetical protein
MGFDPDNTKLYEFSIIFLHRIHLSFFEASRAVYLAVIHLLPFGGASCLKIVSLTLHWVGSGLRMIFFLLETYSGLLFSSLPFPVNASLEVLLKFQFFLLSSYFVVDQGSM